MAITASGPSTQLSVEAQYQQQKKDTSSNPTPVAIGQGDKVVTFMVNVTADSGGNSFSGKDPEQQKVALAKLLFPNNSKAIELLNELSANLEAAGIKSANIEVVEGKIVITKINGDSDKSLALFMKNRILFQGDAKQSEITAKLIMSIMKMASEARSDLIKAIIKSMEDNHKMWMEMLKQLAKSDAEKKIEVKALLEKLMSKVAGGDDEAAKQVASLLASVGIPVGTISFDDIKHLNAAMKKEEKEDGLQEFIKEIDGNVARTDNVSLKSTRENDFELAKLTKSLLNIEYV